MTGKCQRSLPKDLSRSVIPIAPLVVAGIFRCTIDRRRVKECISNVHSLRQQLFHFFFIRGRGHTHDSFPCSRAPPQIPLDPFLMFCTAWSPPYLSITFNMKCSFPSCKLPASLWFWTLRLSGRHPPRKGLPVLLLPADSP